VTSKDTEWVFRVADPKNCYGMRLQPDVDGASRVHTPSHVHIERYVVVDGEHLESAAFPLPRPLDSKYDIKLEIRGSQFLTYVQGQLVDRWNDARFSRGGFGYYSGAGAAAPIKSVRFTDLAALRMHTQAGTPVPPSVRSE
jgi:hypothetical protein